MLFNSYEFIFCFLPIALLLFLGLGKIGKGHYALSALTLASLGFYAWWEPENLFLILFSITFNYFWGHALSSPRLGKNKAALIFGLAVNLGILGYFKYAGFLSASLNELAGTSLPVLQFSLPLGISFFTFLQISYLVDASKGHAKNYRFRDYCLFVTFFPHLIAGPLVHHDRLIHQFDAGKITRFNPLNFSLGLTIFAFGLFKKVIIADNLSPYSGMLFDLVRHGTAPSFFEAWFAALSYTFQLYFDFSGYSDMAIGLSCLFNIKLPINFFSPYQARNIIEFWHRWHITLSNFLRDYVYIPLGGNKKGPTRRYVNLMITMLLGGLWHGAGWTFIVWGGLHGTYLLINHGWRALFPINKLHKPALLTRLASQGLTFVAVTVAWVFFRADSFGTASRIICGMFGGGEVSLPESLAKSLSGLSQLGVVFQGILPNIDAPILPLLLWLSVSAFVAFCLPNLMTLTASFEPALDLNGQLGKENTAASFWTRLRWQPSTAWAWLTAVIVVIGILNLSHAGEFLYFQF